MLAVGYGGDLSRVTEQGRRTQRAGAKTVYKIFLRFFEPTHVIKRGPAYYLLAYRGNGVLSVEVKSPARVFVKYEQVGLPSAPFYEHQRGGLLALCELIGAKNGRAECVEGGGPNLPAPSTFLGPFKRGHLKQDLQLDFTRAG
jgi:hypothetical protein